MNLLYNIRFPFRNAGCCDQHIKYVVFSVAADVRRNLSVAEAKGRANGEC